LLGDFGIAIVSQSMGYRLQKLQEFEGTILYAAPEQIRGRPRIASDQYALGVVVYDWLTGSCPFYGSIEEIARQHTMSPPPPLREKIPTISLAVEQVVLKALAKDPNERFESVQEFAKALERASRPGQPGMGTRQTSPPSLLPSSPLPPKTSSPGATTPTPQVTLLTYHGHSDRIHALAWSPDSHDSQLIASSSLDETVQLWKALTGDNVLTYRGNSLQAQAITWSPDGKFIASTSGLLSETVHIWDTSTGHSSPKHATYAGHAESIQALAWSPDGKFIASASDDATVQVLNATTGRTIFTYRGHRLGVKTVAWSPDGKRIASGSEDKTVQVWNAATGGNIVAYYAHGDKVNSLTWSPGGTHIASASDDATAQVWDASTGRKVFTYSGHTASVTGVAWSPDGLRIASSSLDETVQVWHAITGRSILTYSGHSDWVSTVAWSPDGQRIASGSWDKTVQVWKI
jgi:WD40 repeat protein